MGVRDPIAAVYELKESLLSEEERRSSQISRTDAAVIEVEQVDRNQRLRYFGVYTVDVEACIDIG